jgi:hypothetical protein
MTKHISTSEAAQKAGMSRERLVRKVQVGEIRGENIAGRWFVDPASLARFVARLAESEAGR